MRKSPKKLLDQVREKLRLKHYSIRTEESYVSWIRRFILFHNKRHPKDMGEAEIEEFLTHLAVKKSVAQSTQNQALNAIIFLYGEILRIELKEPINAIRAKRPRRLPTVLTKNEVRDVINALSGTYKTMGSLLYGSGLRLMECIRLRVKDIDFNMNQIVVRDGKGAKDRVTVLPKGVTGDLKEHLKRVQLLHKDDLANGFGTVYLPYALERKSKNANRQWIWQYVFHLRAFLRILAPGSSAAIISTKAHSREPLKVQLALQGYQSTSPAIPSAIVLQRIYSRTVMIFEPYRNCLVTRMSTRP